MDVNDTPITNSVPDTIRERRLEKYLADRDGYRAAMGNLLSGLGPSQRLRHCNTSLTSHTEGTWAVGSRLSGIRDGMVATLASQTRRNWKTHYVDSLTDKDTGFWIPI